MSSVDIGNYLGLVVKTVSCTLMRQKLLVSHVLAGMMGLYTRCTGLFNEHDSSYYQFHSAGDVIRLWPL
jgi:hypothetical protein